MPERSSSSTPGPALLVAFRDVLGEGELRAALAGFGGDDRATSALRATAGDALDLSLAAHRAALLGWLRAWGCRHLRVADSGRSSAALARWWRRWSDGLPPHGRSIVGLRERDLAHLEQAYAALASLPAARRATVAGDVTVTFGDTAAAKALFALRPLAFPPWDEPIRLAFGRSRGEGELYRRYVELTGDAVRGCAARLGVGVSRLPTALGRPSSTPAQVVDEYLWIAVRSPVGPATT